MNRVLVIGCPGSGKTTFSKILSERTGLPVVHLDGIFHRDNWSHISKEEFDKLLQSELNKTKWIIDGNYNRTLKHRLEYCDTVFYFDFPARICLYRAILRTVKGYGRPREEFGCNCIEKFDMDKLKFYKSILAFRKEHRKDYLNFLSHYPNVEKVVFSKPTDVINFLESLKRC